MAESVHPEDGQNKPLKIELEEAEDLDEWWSRIELATSLQRACEEFDQTWYTNAIYGIAGIAVYIGASVAMNCFENETVKNKILPAIQAISAGFAGRGISGTAGLRYDELIFTTSVNDALKKFKENNPRVRHLIKCHGESLSDLDIKLLDANKWSKAIREVLKKLIKVLPTTNNKIPVIKDILEVFDIDEMDMAIGALLDIIFTKAYSELKMPETSFTTICIIVVVIILFVLFLYLAYEYASRQSNMVRDVLDSIENLKKMPDSSEVKELLEHCSNNLDSQ